MVSLVHSNKVETNVTTGKLKKCLRKYYNDRNIVETTQVRVVVHSSKEEGMCDVIVLC